MDANIAVELEFLLHLSRFWSHEGTIEDYGHSCRAIKMNALVDFVRPFQNNLKTLF